MKGPSGYASFIRTPGLPIFQNKKAQVASLLSSHWVQNTADLSKLGQNSHQKRRLQSPPPTLGINSLGTYTNPTTTIHALQPSICSASKQSCNARARKNIGDGPFRGSGFWAWPLPNRRALRVARFTSVTLQCSTHNFTLYKTKTLKLQQTLSNQNLAGRL